MFGLDLNSWNTVMLWFLAIGAVAAVVVMGSSAAVIKIQKREAIEAEEQIAALHAEAGIANERAAKADLARVELEAKLLPRALNQDQWDFIQGLRGKMSEIAIAFETDAETQWFAGQIRNAFFSAGISVAMYPRAAEVHSFGVLIYEPKGFEGARLRTAGPLVEIFSKMEFVGTVAAITEVPSDILLSREKMRPEMAAPLDTPMIILGGRFILPPPELERAAKAAKAARDAATKRTSSP